MPAPFVNPAKASDALNNAKKQDEGLSEEHPHSYGHHDVPSDVTHTHDSDLPIVLVVLLTFSYAAAATGFTGGEAEPLFCLFNVLATVPAEELELFVGLTC